MTKKNLIERLLINLEEEAESLRNSAESARQAAIDAPGAMQSKSDTTKSQMSRLAENLSSLYHQTQRSISALREIDTSRTCKVVEIGAIVKIKEGQNEDYYFILPPGCGGQSIKLEKQEVNTIAVNSPMAQVLLNKKAGDVVKVKVPAGLRVFRVIEIE